MRQSHACLRSMPSLLHHLWQLLGICVRRGAPNYSRQRSINQDEAALFFMKKLLLPDRSAHACLIDALAMFAS